MAVARSRRPTSPIREPRRLVAVGWPCPLSLTSMTMSLPSTEMSTVAWAPSAWRITFVSPSWTMRKLVVCSALGRVVERPTSPQGDREAGVPGLQHELGDVLELGGGGGLLVVGRFAQRAERVAEVVEGLDADPLDAFEHVHGPFGLLATDVDADRGLRADRRDAVGDDVVHLARDAHALLVDAPARFQRAGACSARSARSRVAATKDL